MAFQAIGYQVWVTQRTVTAAWLSLLLLSLSSVARADTATSDDGWIWWPKVGTASLTWGFWKIYDSELRTPNGRYEGLNDEPLALVITYSRDIDAEDLMEATVEQWQHLGYSNADITRWKPLMKGAWPDVREGDRLAYVLDDDVGRFYYQAVNGTPRLTLTMTAPDLAEAFADIWLSPNTSYPELRLALIGGDL